MSRKRNIPLAAIAALALFISPLSAQVVDKETPLDVRLAERLSSESNQTGDTFETLLDEPLYAGNVLLAPKGALLIGEILEAKESGDVKGRAMMRMTLRSIVIDGHEYRLDTNDIEVRATGSRKEDAAKIGGGAGIGAVIGAIIGGGKGAAIGAAIGAGAGTTAVLVTDGDEVEFDVEQEFRFFLEEDLRLRAYSGPSDVSADRRQDRDDEDRHDDNRDNSFGDSRDAERDDQRSREPRGDAFPQLHEQLRKLIERSEVPLEIMQRLLRNNPGWADESFALRSFHSSLEIFSDLWEDHSPRDLMAAQQLLVGQFEETDRMMRESALPRDLWDSWRQVKAAVEDFDRSFQQQGEREFRPEEPEVSLSGRLVWSGRVDHRDTITLRGSNVSVNHLAGRRTEDISSSLSSALPRRAVRMELKKLEGRGTVTLIEQPSRWNDYQAVVLIEDERGGADRYEFELTWENFN